MNSDYTRLTNGHQISNLTGKDVGSHWRNMATYDRVLDNAAREVRTEAFRKAHDDARHPGLFAGEPLGLYDRNASRLTAYINDRTARANVMQHAKDQVIDRGGKSLESASQYRPGRAARTTKAW